jgi:OMF family outer membrane factor
MLPLIRGRLNLEEAVAYTLQHSPSLRAVVQEQEKARGQLWTAYSGALPTVEASADYTRLDEVPTVDLGITKFRVGDKDNYSYQFTITQPLFRGGATLSAIEGARLFGLLSDERVRRVVQDVILQVAIAYHDVLLAQKLHEVQVAALEFAEANLRHVMGLEDAGAGATDYNVLRARVEVANVTGDMLRQRNLLKRAWTSLFRAMGASQKSDVVLTDRLVHRAMAPDYEAAVGLAFSARPELAEGELDVRMQEVALRALHSEYLPELEAWGSAKQARPNPHESSDIHWDDQWMAGLRLTWTLFDGLLREGKIIQQRAALRQSLISLSEAEQQVLEEIKNAMSDLEDANELVDAQQKSVETADDALRLVEQGVKDGELTELHVLDARQAATRSRGLYYQALHAHCVARIALQRAIGMLGTGPGSQEVPEKGPEIGTIPAFREDTEPAPGPATRE